MSDTAAQATSEERPAALDLRGITKRYGPLYANHDVSLRVPAQSIHALIGENGAGKSTLMKIAYGHVRADGGEIWIRASRSASTRWRSRSRAAWAWCTSTSCWSAR